MSIRFLDNLVKGYHAKIKKKMTVAITLDQKLGNNSKR